MRRLAALLALTAALVAAPAAAAAPLHVLVTNDDGVRAAGIDTLVEALHAEPDVRVSIVAPAANQSGTGGRTTPDPLAAAPARTRSGRDAIAVDGTPADSVRYALDTVLVGDLPDLVLSGINEGPNLGPVSSLSGTVGAARAAARRGLPALASSQGLATPMRYDDGVAATIGWLREHRDALAPGTLQNLNIPGCRFGAHVLGTIAVPSALTFDWDTLLALASPSVCRATGHAPRDDVRAFRQGYAALSPLAT